MKKCKLFVFFAMLTTCAAIIVISCKNIGNNKRILAGKYYLVKSEDLDVYYVTFEGNPNRGGVFEGVVNTIGWSKSKIFAEITPLVNTGNRVWKCLNVDTGHVELEMQIASPEDAARKFGISIHPVRDAWRLLR